MPPGTIIQLLVGVCALALLWTTWWFKRTDSKKQERDKLHADWKDAVESGDPARISNMLTRMRSFKP